MTKAIEGSRSLKRTLQDVYDRDTDDDNKEPACKKTRHMNHVVMTDDAWANVLQFTDFVSGTKFSMACKHFETLFRNHGVIRPHEILSLGNTERECFHKKLSVFMMTNYRWLEMITNCCFPELQVFRLYDILYSNVAKGITILKHCFGMAHTVSAADVLSYIVNKFSNVDFFIAQLLNTVVVSGDIEVLEFFARNTYSNATREEILSISRCELFLLSENFDEYKRTISGVFDKMVYRGDSTYSRINHSLIRLLIVVPKEFLTKIVLKQDDRYFKIWIQELERFIDDMPIPAEPSSMHVVTTYEAFLLSCFIKMTNTIHINARAFERFDVVLMLMQRLDDKLGDEVYVDRELFYAKFCRILGIILQRCLPIANQNAEKFAVWLKKLIELWNMRENTENRVQRRESFREISKCLIENKRYDLIEKIYRELSLDAILELSRAYELPIDSNTTKVVEMLVERCMIPDEGINEKPLPLKPWRRFRLLRYILIQCTLNNCSGMALRCMDVLVKYCSLNTPSIYMTFSLRDNISKKKARVFCRILATLEWVLIISDLYRYERIKKAVSRVIELPVTEVKNKFIMLPGVDYDENIKLRAEHIHVSYVESDGDDVENEEG